MKRIVALMVTSFVFIYGCDRSVAQSAPTPGVYTCESLAYKDQGYSFILENNSTYHNMKERINYRYSYTQDEDGIRDIKWEGIYQNFDSSLYYERADGETFITLRGKTKNWQVCRLYVVN